MIIDIVTHVYIHKQSFQWPVKVIILIYWTLITQITGTEWVWPNGQAMIECLPCDLL